MKRALVVGGTGFIGLSIVDELLARGVEVRVTRRRSSVTFLVRKRPVELVQASLDDREALARAMDGCETVFVAAGHYPRYSLSLQQSVQTGVSEIRNACAAALAAGVRSLVYTSSVATLDRPREPRPADERDVPPHMPRESAYRATKWAMERVVDQAVADGLPATTLLPGGCLGPGELRVGTGGVLVGTVRGALPWWVDGLVHLADVQDVARAHVEAATHVRPGERYVLAGHSVHVGELLSRIVRRYGGRIPQEQLDVEAARLRADEDERRAAPRRERVPVPRELVDMVAAGQPVSSARAERELAFAPRPLERTLDRAHAWFARCGYVPAPPAQRGRMHEHG